MGITIHLGWWLAPLAVTAAAFIWHWWVHKDEVTGTGYGAIGDALGQLLTFSAATIASLIAWLVWALAA